MSVSFKFFDKNKYITKDRWDHLLNEKYAIAEEVILQKNLDWSVNAMIGWMDFELFASKRELEKIEQFAKKIIENYDVLVISGVGGSIQATLAVLNCLKRGRIETYFIGNSLSAKSIQNLLNNISNKKVYFINIAKNFETLEPGIGFRIMTDYLKRTTADYAEHISVIGMKGSSLHQLAIQEGYQFWTFYDEIGGRYSGLSVVSLLPLAVNEISIKDYIAGAKELQKQYFSHSIMENPSYHYAISRYELSNMRKSIEIFAHFEPFFEHIAKWCVQLFAESEGKDYKGIFPTRANYSEDLHAIGQYVQEGKRTLFETFIQVEKLNDQLPIPRNFISDHFDYLEGMSLNEINKAAYNATVSAHNDADVPCLEISIVELTPYNLGQLFYFFMVSCFISARLIDVNPFNQNGVEAYKKYMFDTLKR